MDETELNTLANDVADILEKRGDDSNKAVLALLGSCTLLAGASYFGIKIVRNAVDAHRLRKLKKVEQ